MRLTTYIILIVVQVICQFCSAQVVVFSDPSIVSYNNINGTTDLDPPIEDIIPNPGVDISKCSSIQFQLDYSFSEFWEGSGNMEFCNDPASLCVGNTTLCGCDPLINPIPNECECWDFMYIRCIIDGVVVADRLIGDTNTTNADKQNSYNSQPICTNGGLQANLNIINYNGAGDETNIYSNIVITCWEGTPIMDPIPMVCQESDLTLSGNACDPSVLQSSLWESNMGAIISNPSLGNTTATNFSDGEVFTLTATDLNSCSATTSESISTLPTPQIGVNTITACYNELIMFDLTTLNLMVGVGNVVWYNGDPSNGGVPIASDVNTDLTDLSLDLWVELTDSNGCSNAVSILINDLGVPLLTYSGEILFCEGENIVLEANDEDNIMTYNWFHPNTATLYTGNPWVIQDGSPLTNGGIYEVTVTDPGTLCTSSTSVSISVLPEPSLVVTMNGSITSTLTVCQGSDVTMSEVGIFGTAWEWTNSSGAIVDNTSDFSLNNVQQSNTDTYTVEITSIDNCTSSQDIMLIVEAAPMLNTITITECNSALSNYILDSQNLNIYGNAATFTWWDGDPNLASSTQLNSSASTDISGINPVWVQVQDATNQCIAVAAIPVSITQGPSGCIQGDLEVCEGGCAKFNFVLSGGSGNYSAEVFIEFLGIPLGPFQILGVTTNSSFNLCFDPDIAFPNINGTDITLPTCDPFGIFCLSEGDIITVELISIYDVTLQCEGIVDPACNQTIEYHEAPEAKTFTLSGCDAIFQNYDLDGKHANEVNNLLGLDDVSWWEGQPSMSGASELSGSSANFTTSTDLWAMVTHPTTGCTAEVMITIESSDPPTFTIDGGTSLCINECSNGNDQLTLTINGGVGPYDIYFEIITANGVFDSGVYQNMSTASNTISVCVEDIVGSVDICLPENGCTPPVITISPDQIGLTSITIIDVIDDGSDGDDSNDIGCEGIINNPTTVDFDISPNPVLTMVTDEELCGTTTLDLVNYEAIINQTNQVYDFTWLDNCTNVITNINNYSVSSNTTLCYEVGNSNGCISSGSFDITVVNSPSIAQPIADQVFSSCGVFTLPNIVIDNESINAVFGYYTGPGATGNMFEPGDQIPSSTTLYVHVENGLLGCTDEISITINILSEITFGDPPIPPNNCGCITLPPIENGTSTVMYYSQPNGMGNVFGIGDQICTEGDYTLFIYDIGSNQDCIATPLPEITFSIQSGITLTSFSPVEACDTYTLPNIDGDNLVNPSYNTMADGTGITYMPGDIITTSLQLFAIDQEVGCSMVSQPLDISIIPLSEPGVDSTISVCAGYNNTIDITPVLSGDLCGNWSTTSSIDVSNPNTISVTNQLENTYLLTYSCISNSCPEVTTSVIIDIIPPPFVIGGNSASLCNSSESEFDLFSLLDSYSQGSPFNGEWTMITLALPSLPIGESCIIPSDYMPGIYEFEYMSTNLDADLCEPSFATVTIIIEEEIDAGPDITNIGVCSGDTVNLSLYVPTSGTYGEANVSGGLLDSLFITDNLLPGNYPIIYTVDSNGHCPPDEALITVELTPTLSAGIDTTSLFCSGSVISLYAALSADANSGGDFYNSVGDLIDPSNYTVGLSETFVYQVGNPSGSCPLTSANVSISPLPIPSFSSTVTNMDLCDLDCIDFEIDAVNGSIFDFTFEVASSTFLPITYINEQSSNGTSVLFQICNSSESTGYASGVLNLDNTTESEYNLIVNQFGNESCSGQIGQIWTFGLFGNTTREVTGTYCQEDNYSITIDDEIFDFTNPSGIKEIPNPASICDSTIIIDLIFLESNPTLLQPSTCSGQSIMIAGQTISDDDDNGIEEGSIILDNQSFTGCDSIINYIAIFDNAVIGLPITGTYCYNDTIRINDEDYTIENPGGLDTIANGSAGGCDSIINIDLLFLTMAEGIFIQDICVGDTITIGNDDYYKGNESGNTTLPNASENGCDSLIRVALNVLDTPERIVNFELCPNDEKLLYGITMSEDNLFSTTTIPSQSTGCDSLITLSGVLLLPGVQDLSMNLCETDTLQVGNDTYTMSNPIGQSTLGIPASNGCDSIVNVNLNFNLNSESTYIDTLCGEATVVINGTTYGMANPAGIETLLNQNNTGCDSIINILIFSDFDYSYTVKSPCTNEDQADLTIENVIGGSGDYQILVNESIFEFTDNDLPFTVSYDIGVFVDFVIKDNLSGCEAIQSNGEPIQPSLASNLTIVPSVNDANSYTLAVETDFEVVSYLWTATSGIIECPDCETSSIVISENTEVLLTLTYANGCEESDSITLSVDKKNTIFIPNVFNPNSTDPILNSFYVQSANDNDRVDNLSVFDRWGNLVFQSLNSPVNDPSFGWNGKTYDSTNVEQGVYIFVAEISKENGDVELVTGDVTIVR